MNNTIGENAGALTVDTQGSVIISNNVMFSENESVASGGAMKALGGFEIGDNATFIGNKTKKGGGAIYIRQSSNSGETTDENATTAKIGKSAIFEGNIAGNKDGSSWLGGAIAAEYVPEGLEIGENAQFRGNTAADGGAIYNGDPDKRGEDSGTLNVKNSSCINNEAKQGGAIISGTSAKNLTITGSDFANNVAELGGGAIWSGAKTDIKNSIFIGNEVSGSEYGNDMLDDVSEGGAAIFVGSSSQTIVKNSTFKNNTSGTVGGAIATRSDSKGKSHLTIENSIFTNNSAEISGGALNIASTEENVTLKGKNIFSGNNVKGKLNDIHNLGIITVAENSILTLDGGITGEGTTSFDKNTTLNIKDTTKISNTVITEGTELNVVLSTGAKELNLTEIFGVEEAIENMTLNTSNGLYTFSAKDDLYYEVAQKSSAEVAKSLGVNATTASAVLTAVSDANSNNTVFNNISETLNEAAQLGNTSVVREASKLGADAAPVVHTVETMRGNMVFAAVNDELNNATGAMAEGMSAGDYFHKAKAWIRGLFNYADKNGTSKAAGFDADTYGIAMGIDKELDNHVKAGFGYAYSQTDVNGKGRDTDVDSHTLFIYGQYKPADWYINTALAYSWSDYDEKKSVLGYNANAKYDVDTIAIQAMYGFESKLGEYDLNPEFGFRYMHIEQDGYTDKLGSKVKSKDSDVLTLVAGVKVANDYELESGMVMRPELKAAVTYDVVSDDNNANVMLANGVGYKVRGEKLDRLGLELGAKIATNIADNWEVSAGYEVKLREDYQDNTLMFNAKYNF